jgi:hypothetical protein
MPTINAVPEKVDVTGYGGDTLSIRVNVSGQAWTNPQWSAEVRESRTTADVDAAFTITPDSTGAWLVLSAAQTASLLGAVVARQQGKAIPLLLTKYVGQWDVQVKDGATVVTLAQGSLTIEADVTRVP